MIQFGEVAKNAYFLVRAKDEKKSVIQDYTRERETIEKRYRRYRDSMIETMGIKQHVHLLAKNRKYVFKERGAELLSEVLALYHMYGEHEEDSTIKKKNSKTQKSFLKKVITDEQYNGVLSYNEMKHFQRIVDANNIVVKMLECFYQLFKDVGLADNDIDEIMREAFEKLRYSERVCYNNTFGILLKYLNKLMCIHKEQSVKKQITNTESAIWLHYSNTCLEDVMCNIFSVRLIMDDIRRGEQQRSIKKSFGILDEDSPYSAFVQEERLYQMCLDDDEMRHHIYRYNQVSENEMNLKSFINQVLACEGINDMQRKVRLLISMLEHADDGEGITTKTSIKQRNDAIKNMVERIFEIKEGYYADLIENDETCIQIRNFELLQAAIEKNEMLEERSRRENNLRFEFECCRK